MVITSDVTVKVEGGELPEEEIKSYVDYIQNKYKKKTLEALTITVDGDYVGLRSRFAPMKFQRIRRITGYLTGDLNSWNNAKRAEEHDRVKHV